MRDLLQSEEFLKLIVIFGAVCTLGSIALGWGGLELGITLVIRKVILLNCTNCQSKNTWFPSAFTGSFRQVRLNTYMLHIAYYYRRRNFPLAQRFGKIGKMVMRTSSSISSTSRILRRWLPRKLN